MSLVIGIPILFLFGAGVYAFYKKRKENPTSPTDGGTYKPKTADAKEVKGGPSESFVVTESAITNPSVSVPLVGQSAPGKVRDAARRGGDPFQNTKNVKPMTRGSDRLGVDLFPKGLRQYGLTDPRNKGTQMKTTPDVRTEGLSKPPDPLSGLIIAQKMGLGKSGSTFFSTLSQNQHYMERAHPSAVPDNWAKIDPLAATDPPTDDFWESKREIGPALDYVSRRSGPGKKQGPKFGSGVSIVRKN